MSAQVPVVGRLSRAPGDGSVKLPVRRAVSPVGTSRALFEVLLRQLHDLEDAVLRPEVRSKPDKLIPHFPHVTRRF